MTLEQKITLRSYVNWHKPIYRVGENGETFYLNNGEIVEFTDIENTNSNSKYTINHDPNRSIWYSQLNRVFITEDFELCVGTLKVDEKESTFYYTDNSDFWNLAKGRKFRVVTEGPYYIINKDSDLLDEKELYTTENVLDYVKDCVKNDRISDIGNLLKIATCYNLFEVKD